MELSNTQALTNLSESVIFSENMTDIEKQLINGSETNGLIDPSDNFQSQLQFFRQRTGRSRNSVAYEAGIDPSYLTRIERNERGSPRTYIVEAIIRVLDLTNQEKNQLRVAGNIAPTPMAMGWRPVFQAVLEVENSSLSLEEIAEYEKIILVISKLYSRNKENPLDS